MKTTEHTAKSAPTSKTGIFAVLGGLLRGKGSGLSKIGSSQAGPQIWTADKSRHPSRLRDSISGPAGQMSGSCAGAPAGGGAGGRGGWRRWCAVHCVAPALVALGAVLLSAAPALAASEGEAPETGAASRVTATTAVLNGTLNPHSKTNSGSWTFDYGPYSAGECGSKHTAFEPEPVFEGEAQGVQAEITGLTPNTRYTFCLESSANQAFVGKEVQFTTRAVVPSPIGSGAEAGAGAGQLDSPWGVALDAGGDVYVSDQFNYRVDKFAAAGSFSFAWGWGVDRSSPAEESQTCTSSTECRAGHTGQGAGEFSGEGPRGVAVDDNEPLSGDLSAGDVYVVDTENFRVEKFNAAGRFLSMFGGEVNEGKDGTPGATQAEKDVCAAAEKCKRGTEGTGDGEFEWAYEPHGIIAVGPGGDVYVGDRARVEVFEPSGAWKENISLAGLSGEAKVAALAVNAAGDVFVKDKEVPGVHELEPDGVEMPVRFDETSEAIEGIALDPSSGDLFVADGAGGLHILEYDAAGTELAGFGAKTAVATNGIAFSGASGKELLYVSNAAAANVWVLPVPPAGPLVVPDGELAQPGLRGAAKFEASVNPEGNATEVKFEYVEEARFQSEGFAGASSTPASAIGAGFEEQHAEASLPAKALAPGVSYRWRVVASDTAAHTTYGEAQSFTELPSVDVEGPWAANVASTSATLAARVDPLSSSTDYRLEWGTSTAYGHVLSGSAGEGSGYVAIADHLQELEPDTVYHYRLVTSSEFGAVEGADHEFRTQLGTGEELSLPDGRAWEQVSPVSKGGALIQPLGSFHAIEAAADGSGIAYEASATIGENPVGKSDSSEVISTRGADGWSTRDISIPYELPPAGAAAEGGENPTYDLFSADLSSSLVEQAFVSVRPLSPEATERTPYLRDDLTCESQPQACYTPLVTSANVEPSNVPFGGSDLSTAVHVVGGTPDLSHVILESPYALTKGAISKVEPGGGSENLYEWSGGRLQLVNVLPNRESRPGAYLGYHTGNVSYYAVAHTVSSDGRRIVWSLEAEGEPGKELFVRDMVAEKTVKIGGANANYQTMSSDGSRVFFREGGELYELNLDTETRTDITAAHGGGEASAGVQDAVLGASEAGCDLGASGECNVYFVAKGVLGGVNAEGHAPVAGEDNLYVSHAGAGGWSTTYIATLSSEDEHSWFENTTPDEGSCNCGGVRRNGVSSRVSANGRYVTFMSERSLTGYDNLDAVSGQPDEEVYLYDAVAKRLVCASCDPTGARPVGVLDGENPLLVDPEHAWGGEGATPHWLAGMIPSWEQNSVITAETSFYQPRFLSDGGRLFFDSPDGLVPQATNGLMDVYEYEPAGEGSCTAASATFSEREAGCVGLISGGSSGQESMFYDASESGDDVFFITASKLAATDVDTAYDVYDARVCTAAAPCPAAAVSPPPCTSGDSCKAAPSPQPAIFGAPPSATFNGAGNLTPPAPAVVRKTKTLTRAQKLAAALRACRKKPKQKARSACEAAAQRRHGKAKKRRKRAQKTTGRTSR